jgi:predicted small secreted protein
MRKRKIEKAFEHKKKLMKALRQAEYAVEDYRNAVNKCDVVVGKLRGLLVVLILLIMFLGGCCTMKGALEDTSWILRTTADNIQPKEK